MFLRLPRLTPLSLQVEHLLSLGHSRFRSIAEFGKRQSRPVRRRATELLAGKGRALSEAVGRVA